MKNPKQYMNIVIWEPGDASTFLKPLYISIRPAYIRVFMRPIESTSHVGMSRYPVLFLTPSELGDMSLQSLGLCQFGGIFEDPQAIYRIPSLTGEVVLVVLGGIFQLFLVAKWWYWALEFLTTSRLKFNLFTFRK